MIRGLYTAADGALVAQAAVDNIANNLANVSTTGFKSTLMQVQSNDPLTIARNQTDPNGDPVTSDVGDLGTGAQLYNTPTSFTQGPLQQTSNPLDLAINGNAFFSIQTPQGLRYTRDGSFLRNGQGILVTKDGNLVLGGNGSAINLPEGTISVGQDGTIRVDQQAVGVLKLTSFGNLTNLGKQGSNLFYDAGAQPQPNTTTTGLSTVSQGYLEGSNAEVVRSIVDLIGAQRWFEANQKAILTQDTATSQALQTVGNSKA